MPEQNNAIGKMSGALAFSDGVNAKMPQARNLLETEELSEWLRKIGSPKWARIDEERAAKTKDWLAKVGRGWMIRSGELREATLVEIYGVSL